jgi:transposase
MYFELLTYGRTADSYCSGTSEVAMFVRTKKRDNRVYLQIVENQRVEGKVSQRVLFNLGRLDILQATGKLDDLMVSMQRFSEKLAILGAFANGAFSSSYTKKIGPSIIFERLWQEMGIGAVIQDAAKTRGFEFSVERVAFITVLHRLISPGSDRQAERWMEDYYIPGKEEIDLHHFYRSMGFLGEALPAQQDALPLSPRCVKDQIEERLFARRRDLFTHLNLVFFDTTSLYFEGEGGEALGQYGMSKDHRPDLKQMVVGVVLDHEGNPICSEYWPGNTTDVTTLIPVATRLKERFPIDEVCIVADRGMISAKTIKELDERNWKYILGVRMRAMKEARDEVLSCGGRYQEVTPKGEGSKDPSPLKVKEVIVKDRRYIVCLNEDQAKKDRHDREAIVSSLKQALSQGDKSLVGNKGYRRYLKNPQGHFTIDEDKIKDEERYDGKWVLTTNTDLTAKDTALKYKQLWTVESVFRSMKSLLETRPIYHKCDDTIRGHVFCSFLALLLRKKLQDLMEDSKEDAEEKTPEWADIIRDLDNLSEMEVEVNEKKFTIRSDAKRMAVKAFRVCKVALPPLLRAANPK